MLQQLFLYSPEEIIQKELIKCLPYFLQQSWAPVTSAEEVGAGAPRCQEAALPAQDKHNLSWETYLLLTAAFLRELSAGRAGELWLQAKLRSARPHTGPWGNDVFPE